MGLHERDRAGGRRSEVARGRSGRLVRRRRREALVGIVVHEEHRDHRDAHRKTHVLRAHRERRCHCYTQSHTHKEYCTVIRVPISHKSTRVKGLKGFTMHNEAEPTRTRTHRSKTHAPTRMIVRIGDWRSSVLIGARSPCRLLAAAGALARTRARAPS